MPAPSRPDPMRTRMPGGSGGDLSHKHVPGSHVERLQMIVGGTLFTGFWRVLPGGMWEEMASMMPGWPGAMDAAGDLVCTCRGTEDFRATALTAGLQLAWQHG